jgi:hypothetical protein
VNRSVGTKRWLAVVVAGVLALLAARNATAADSRELKAREAFAAQRYQEALDLFAKLYAETLHPIYLRNIGRCYQNLAEPEKAITSFREYLRKGKNVSAKETEEIEGYIKEMEELQRRKEASAASSTSTTTEKPDAPVKPLPSATPPPATNTATASVVLTPPPPQTEESSPIYGRWWFWAIVGGVVASGVGIAFAAGAFTKTEEPTCPIGVATCGTP